ncbi:12220_t:CDS:2, partial [Racocetra persica]
DGLVCGSINNDPIMTNTTSLPCQGNCDKTKKTVSTTTPELSELQTYFQQQGINSLSASELDTNTGSPDKNNY